MICYWFREHNNELNKTAYHEVGHFLLVYLFINEFNFQKVTINKKLANSKFKDSNGGAGFSLIPDLNSDFYNLKDKIAVIAMSGMCSQNLFFADKNGLSHSDRIPHFINDPNKNMNNIGGIPDFNIVKKNVVIITGYLNVNGQEYLKEMISYIFTFLSEDTTWNFAKLLVYRLLKKRDLTLSIEEIEVIAKQNGYEQFLNSKRIEILNRRYPIV